MRDDGAGINPERVLKKARERGLVGRDASLTDDEINNLIFMPGFSTAESVSDISGRGVGMDVVRTQYPGSSAAASSLKSERGRGMTIQLALPLTLAVMDGMVIRVGRETYVMPMSAIVECLRPPALGHPQLWSARAACCSCAASWFRSSISAICSTSARRPSGVRRAGGDHHRSRRRRRFGIVVDELCGHQQVVIKSIEESYGSVPGIAGGDHSRQWPRRVHSRYREAFRSRAVTYVVERRGAIRRCSGNDVKVIRSFLPGSHGKLSSGVMQMPAAAILRFWSSTIRTACVK